MAPFHFPRRRRSTTVCSIAPQVAWRYKSWNNFRLALSLATILLIALSARAYEIYKTGDALKRVIKLEMPTSGYPIERTVIKAMKKTFAPTAAIVEALEGQILRKGSFRVHVLRAGTETTVGWFRLQISPDGTSYRKNQHIWAGFNQNQS